MMLSRTARSRARTPGAGCRRSPGTRPCRAATLRRLRSCSHWPAKFVTSAARARIGQHAPHLPLQHRAARAAGPAPASVDQLIVRDAAPQEERQPRCELEVADAIRRPGGHADGSRSAAKDELRIGQNAAKPELDAGLEGSLPTTGSIERQQAIAFRLRDRPAIRARKRAWTESLLRIAVSSGRRGPAGENLRGGSACRLGRWH